MSIRKIRICNFKCFKGEFILEVNEGINILVGNNEAGKSTILEAINIALTGLYNGRHIKTELSQYMFNNEVISNYIESISKGEKVLPPSFIIELYFSEGTCPLFEGNGNAEKTKAEGLMLKVEYNEKYNDEYESLITSRDLLSLPIEYYDVVWESFARQAITSKGILMKCAMIDSTSSRFQNGSDVYISRIIRNLLDSDDITHVAQAHRKMKENFMSDSSIAEINKKINTLPSITKKKIELSVELGTKSAWESSLITQLDSIPFSNIGKGEQCVVKTELALSHKKAQEANIILLEEPECHLSHTKLNQLISAIEAKYNEKQIIISTHSSFVANKLGLDNILLLNQQKAIRFSNLKSNEFFKKIAGYDTLRLILCESAILVEGDSDELVVQRAYMDLHDGRLPIQDGIDVISVGTSFLRFLEIADLLYKQVTVVTDNDGDIEAINKKYVNYIGENLKPYVKLCVDLNVDTGSLVIGKQAYNYNTLEPKLLKANNLTLFNKVLGTSYKKEDDLRIYMKNEKTECALKIFSSSEKINYPDYISKAVKDNE
ncbi:ATP-dependent endonuclease [Dehalobacter sp. MCB1]|uniref:ATP-dependent nuclease n=1 Tax=unclassified Dehalobacter TaxID=2635733 RepID=UPI000E6BBA19|nr:MULTISPECIES: AAA family ATPase [unclassified Dehalobacter]RJE47911.1 ATP-dependent endonuclease [Dehalobacter sp. MCB1]TCX56089.1 ATP-dependent endonuclease [Dehalobacter sp. 12DCB1]